MSILRGIAMRPRFSKFVAVALCGALCASTAASAATVSRHGGSVLVSKDKGFVPMTGDLEVAPGGRIMVQPGGTASIRYAGNCTVRLGPGLWQVQQAAPCADGKTEIDFTGRMNQAGPEDGGGGVNPFIVGGVIATAVGLGIAISQAAGNDSPASP